MKRRAVPCMALALALALPAAGCARLRSPASGPAAEQREAKNFRFPDLPIPVGLSLDLPKSFIFESPGTRAGHLVYTGYRKYENVVGFYREKMPDHGWKLVSSFERGQASLTFEKPGWISTVMVRRRAFGSVVEINIGPRVKDFVEQDIPPKRR